MKKEGSNGRNTLAMLKRQPSETIDELLERLDSAVHNALKHYFITD